MFRQIAVACKERSITLNQFLQNRKKLRKIPSNLLLAWQKGDTVLMHNTGEQDNSMWYDEAQKAYYHKIMLTDRNILMVEKISEFPKSNKTIFVLVDSLHLVGKDGLLALLQAQGFKPEQLIEVNQNKSAVYQALQKWFYQLVPANIRMRLSKQAI